MTLIILLYTPPSLHLCRWFSRHRYRWLMSLNITQMISDNLTKYIIKLRYFTVMFMTYIIVIVTVFF